MTIDPELNSLIDGSASHLLFAAVAGSRAYGLATAHSDHDTRGVFALPAARYLSLAQPPPQINDTRNNHVYFSLRRQLELLDAGNPSMLELVYTPDDCIEYQSPVWTALTSRRAEFVSRRSVEALIGYAQGQIRKARGQNKWINQPQPELKPQPLDHCYYLAAAAMRLDPPCRPRRVADCGLELQRHHAARVEHAHDLFRLYDYGTAAKGVFLHTLRLLLSAQHIVDYGVPLVRVSAEQRRFLLEVRDGKHDYDSLSKMAEGLATACRSNLDHARLAATAPANLCDQLLQQLTAQWEESCL